MEDPHRTASTARLFWLPERDPSVIVARAEQASAFSSDIFDLSQAGERAVVAVNHNGFERLAITDGFHRIRIDIVDGTLRKGPVRLHYHLAGFDQLNHKLLTLRRLMTYLRFGRFTATLHRPEPKSRRWAMMLDAHDLAAAGASQREIAEHLFCAVATDGWRKDSDSSRLQVQRLLRDAKAMINGDYLRLLAGNLPALIQSGG